MVRDLIVDCTDVAARVQVLPSQACRVSITASPSSDATEWRPDGVTARPLRPAVDDPAKTRR